MTEQEWLKYTDPTPMLEFLRGKASERKLRLSAVAVFRRQWYTIAPPGEAHRAVRIVELYADGQEEQLRHMGGIAAARPITVHDSATFRMWYAIALRDIFGNPFRPVSLNPGWRTPAVRNLTIAVYEERNLPSGELDPARLAVLADALEEAGCDNAEMLSHLRSPGPHVRGCWAVDLLLGKESAMTEQEWIECADPMKMVWFLGNRASRRKLQLFACACCRRIIHLLPTKESKKVLTCMERLAESRGTAEELAECRRIASEHSFGDVPRAKQLAFVAVVEQGDSLGDMVEFAANATAWEREGTPEAISEPEVRAQACLVRDIFGNPFRPVSLTAAWLTPTVTVLALASTSYEERILPSGELDTARMSVLADALEEAGCDNTDMLTHLRSPGPHVRGCWVVDLLLGKE